MVPFESIKSVETAQDIIISKQNKNQKWVLIPRLFNNTTTGMFTFNDNGTETSDDDISRLFTFFYDQDGNKFQPTNFLCVAQDQDNALWMGTTDGPIVLNNQSKAFDANYACTRIKIPRNDGTNLADFLLDGMKINAIAVDGANRKWIGTESSGVFLVSANGLETVKHFTSENSPLLSNNIISIGINEKTGEVFFGTGKGLISYQSDAIEGGESFNNVHAFPNPVRETYKGVITITGLVTDSRVKITDITGNVVFETISNGGVATWDGNRRTGDRVATGVYLALCFSPDGKQYATAKILVIN
jgi:ligand-binding sensor domain-containing protein